MSYPAIYRARVTRIDGQRLTVFVPQVFGEASIVIDTFVGNLPTEAGLGWVMFEGGNPEFPVWAGNFIGATGAQGEQGDAGQSGALITQRDYRWKTGITAQDPTHGQVAANNVNAALITEFYVSLYDQQGMAFVGLAQAPIGANFGVYVTADVGKRALYQVSDVVVNHGDQWLTVPVANPSVNNFVPSQNLDIFLYLDMGAGTNEVVIGPTMPTATGLELWVDTSS